MASLPFSIVRTRDQWLRCRHQHTSFDAERGCVELEWKSESHGAAGAAPQGIAAGLAFDPLCRLYRSLPEEGRIEWQHWLPLNPAEVVVADSPANDLMPPESDAPGDFVTRQDAGQLSQPLGLAFDRDGHLFAAEAGRNRVLVYDVAERRLLRVIPLADPAASGPTPVDIATSGNTAFILTTNPTRVVRLTAHGQLHEEALPAGTGSATRIAASSKGRLALLDAATHTIVFLDKDIPSRTIGEHATDIEFENEDTIVAAYWGGQDFERVALGTQPLIRPGLKARGYDGRGIVRTPDGRIGYWTNRGFRTAAPLRIRYEPTGTVTTFQLDSNDWQTVWGRVYVDACVPQGTSVEIHTVASDEPPEEATIERTPPANAAGLAIPYPEASPPMPPLSFAPRDDAGAFTPLFRRGIGRELPWSQADDDQFVTLESPVHSVAGRYLWITLKLIGTTRVSPRVACIRAEYPAHDYLRRLPKTLSRDQNAASFLRRYLAIAEGFLRETDQRAYERATLLDPWATPDEAVPWLASFVGMLLDDRWARAPRANGRVADVRRQLVAEANELFRYRGTVHGLRRFLEIYTGADVAILEHFRTRGLGGGIVGAGGALTSSATIGGGFRVGGALGTPGVSPLNGTSADAFATHAHRFTVVMHTTLNAEQQSVVAHILDTHRPAHTLFEICTVGAGLRVGVGAHVGLSAMVGPSGAFSRLRVGGALGRDAVLGTPKGGIAVGARVDHSATVR